MRLYTPDAGLASGKPSHLPHDDTRMLLEGSGIAPEIVADGGQAPTRSQRLRAALAYARRGVPVFPCKPGGKKPLTKRGFHEATSDPRKITAWWNRWPDANIGVPTGPESGILALDVEAHGFTSLDLLEEEHGQLPHTATTRTGSGGVHILLHYPAGEEIRNSAGLLGIGLDVRGVGGYIIAPPSATTGPYEWLKRTPLSDAPRWLLEALRAPSRVSGDPAAEGIGSENGEIRTDKQGMPFSEATGGRLIVVAGPVGRGIGPGHIPHGTRNTTLTSIAGWLRARGHDQDAILSELVRINAAQCSPPIGEHPEDRDPRELEKIAASAARYAPGTSSTPEPSPEVLAKALQDVEVGIEAETWSGMGGKSERDVMVSLSKIARRRSSLIPAGVRVEVDYRTLALAAGVGRSSAHRAVQRLRRKGWIRYDNAGRTPGDRTVLVLVNANARKAGQRNHGGQAGASGFSVPHCAHRYSAPRLRWSAPRWDRVGDDLIRSTIRRMGKSCGQCVDILEYSGGELALDELYGLVYPDKDPADRKRWRPRDLRRRVISRLETAGVVEVSGDSVRLAADWLEALNRERKIAGEIDADRRDMARYARESEAYREWFALLPEERRALKEQRARARADGFTEDLKSDEAESEEELPEPEVSGLAVAIREYLDANPHNVHQPAGWLGNTLWSFDLHPGKRPPSPKESRAAIEELGGERYLRSKLERSREVA